ncbi:unnamed protein product, partial [Mesorhabditis spiculigera]
MAINRDTLLLFVSLLCRVVVGDAFHPEYSLLRLQSIIGDAASQEDVQALKTMADDLSYCSNKERAVKRWVDNHLQDADPSIGAALRRFARALCTSDRYIRGQVWKALGDDGPLGSDMDTLTEQYTRDFATVYQNDALYAFSAFTVQYMYMLDYSAARMQLMVDALAGIRQLYAPGSTPKRWLICAYRTLYWEPLYLDTPTISYTDSDGLSIFNETVAEGRQLWEQDGAYCDSIKA